MACSRTVMQTLFLMETCWPLHRQNKFGNFSSCCLSTPIGTCGRPSNPINWSYGCRIPRARDYHRFRRRSFQLNFCYDDNHSSTSSSHNEQGPPQEAVLKAISEVSKTEGRIGQTTNVVIGGTVTDDSTNEWLALDQKVNSYPTVRGFTAIGTGGDDFVHSMVVAVESVLQQPIPEGRVRQKISSRGKYVSVNIGPVRVSSSEQVQAVYNAMRRDDRMRYFL
ncbi:hypothetical protein Nepgr_016963 [Nepenthes gracilis]|uniref:Uncharacterized protein n=1 Tax=Nepenthes gracilis TaxID=150966 RepID=A0AAD3SRI4_NEPGR|nr:hypothetical protein Nepgr_016963 [Nepenthes gracilis]